jgi:O-antigen ligase
MLTFSRASVVGLIGSALMFLMIILITQFKFTKKSIVTFFVYGTAVILLLGFTGLYEYLSIPLEYFTNRLFSSRWEDGTSNWDVFNPNSSEGYRIYLIMRILEYVANSPIYGSGFLGIWVILEDQIGSAHGQYNDMLFRTGFLGLLIYLFFLYKLGLYLYKNDMGLFLGYVGILVFGLFHETFKLSQGAFLFAFLVGMWAQSLRKDNENRY